MQRSVPASFFATKRPFHPAEYAAAAGLSPDDPTVKAMLTQHIQAGRVKHIAGDVFSTVREGRDPVKSRVDPFLLVDWLRPGAVLAYHSALDLLQAIAHDPHLGGHVALMGGTGLNGFHSNWPRPSLDIDLTYMGSPEWETALAYRPVCDNARHRAPWWARGGRANLGRPPKARIPDLRRASDRPAAETRRPPTGPRSGTIPTCICGKPASASAAVDSSPTDC